MAIGPLSHLDCLTTKLDRFSYNGRSLDCIDEIVLVTWKDGFVSWDGIAFPKSVPYFYVSGLGVWRSFQRGAFITDLERYAPCYNYGSRTFTYSNPQWPHRLFEYDRSLIIEAILRWKAAGFEPTITPEDYGH